MRLATPIHRALVTTLRLRMDPIESHLWYLDIPQLRGGLVTLARWVVEVIR